MTKAVKHLDLNLLRLFEMVMREESVTRAAARLGLSQPAASNAIKRLRLHCGDPLFVRTSTGIKPTPMASAFLPTVASTLSSPQGAMDQYLNFDPRTSSRAFTLLMLDVGELTMEMFAGRAAMPTVHIPYQGFPQLTTPSSASRSRPASWHPRERSCRHGPTRCASWASVRAAGRR